jgi:hypothetical protein
MNTTWIQRSEKTLEDLKELRKQVELDRLDLVKNMRFAFSALGQSLAGWVQWVNSPEIMSTFTLEELQIMNERIMEMIEEFIQYDIKMTDEGIRKGHDKQRDQEQTSRFVI